MPTASEALLARKGVTSLSKPRRKPRLVSQLDAARKKKEDKAVVPSSAASTQESLGEDEDDELYHVTFANGTKELLTKKQFEALMAKISSQTRDFPNIPNITDPSTLPRMTSEEIQKCHENAANIQAQIRARAMAAVAGPQASGPKVSGPKMAGPKMAGQHVTGPNVTAGPRVQPQQTPGQWAAQAQYPTRHPPQHPPQLPTSPLVAPRAQVQPQPLNYHLQPDQQQLYETRQPELEKYYQSVEQFLAAHQQSLGSLPPMAVPSPWGLLRQQQQQPIYHQRAAPAASPAAASPAAAPAQAASPTAGPPAGESPPPSGLFNKFVNKIGGDSQSSKRAGFFGCLSTPQ